jgi:CheY-like chemotaxis protein
MMQPSHRILCLDSSPARLLMVSRALEKAGFQVWNAASAREAICMAFGLRFDALVMDQGASSKSAGIWNCLRESQPHLPIFIHSRDSGNPRIASGLDQPENSVSSELILACLTILLNPVPRKLNPTACGVQSAAYSPFDPAPLTTDD